MKKLSLTCLGKDKPGIVAKVTEVLFKTGCSIEGSRMSLLQGEFTIIMIFTLYNDENMRILRRELKRVEYEMDIEINLREIEPDEYEPTQKFPSKTYQIHIYGADKPGIVFNVTNILYLNDINIIDLYTDIIESESSKVYLMSITVDGSKIPSIEFLKEKVEKICKDLGLQVSIQEMEEVEM